MCQVMHKHCVKVISICMGWMQWKVAPALAAGNCCILKPSELCSLTCLELAAIAHEVGLPAGVFNVITGTGVDAGAPLRYAAGLLYIPSVPVMLCTANGIRYGGG